MYIDYVFKKYKADFKYWETVFNKIMISIFECVWLYDGFFTYKMYNDDFPCG